MKKRVRIFLILAIFGLICGICCIGHSVNMQHIQQNCPLWDIYDKTCYTCEHQDLVAVDNTVPNRCSNRKIIEDCCHNGFYRSVPDNYVDNHHILDCKYRRENVYDDCMVFDRQLVTFRNARSIILVSLPVLMLIFLISRKTRWIGFCTFSAITSVIFVGKIIDFITYGKWFLNYIGIVSIFGIIVILPIITDLVRIIKKQISKQKLKKDLLTWFLCIFITFLIWGSMVLLSYL